ncbi:hypothetical protein [Planosporangium mesophilum]|uniref:Uncharacterized protein n=1 Tax=Planosporangium mesophilum TaxID=689768 RepID=A0A8J3TFV5_9ACTN|nr:hypothetical protein [Planosporangium mesophilum]NJC85771.1 hypothetical protein [Planosporangium mesophilum]GII24761.1 hypothetical protein Pme01_43580 [Planosporangium mesophilum]
MTSQLDQDSPDQDPSAQDPAPAATRVADGAPPAVGRASGAARRPRSAPTLGRRLLLTAAGLAGAWLAAVALHAARADWLLLVLVVVATAVVLDRAGTLMDRLVLSLITLAGTTCLAGLLFSVWPWHLHPVALGGTALTVVVLLWGVRGRAPSLPRPRRSDLLVAVPAGGFAALLGIPYLVRALPDRFGMLVLGEDLHRHFMVMDSMRRAGGYLFFTPESAVTAQWVMHTDRTYPAGAHMVGAVLDNFLTSTTVPGDATAAYSRFLGYDILAYSMLGLVMIWGARRLAGPSARIFTFWPVAGLICGYLLFGDLFDGWRYGFAPQVVGMTYLVFIMVLAARPLPSTRQQIVALSAAVLGVAFTYYLLLPLAAVPLLLYGWTYRRRLLRHWPVLLTAGVVTVAVAPIPRMKNASDHSWALLVQQFGIRTVPLGHAAVLLALFVLALACARRWSPMLRSVTASVATVVGATAALAAVQLYLIGTLAYFFDKMMYCVIVTALVAAGAATPLLGRLKLGVDGRRRMAVIATACVAAVAAVTGGLEVRPGVATANSGWVNDYLRRNPAGVVAAHLAYRVHRYTPNDDRALIVHTRHRVDTITMQLLCSLRRDRTTDWFTFIWLRYNRTPDEYVESIVASRNDRQYRVVTDDDAILDRMRRLAAERPDLRLDVVDERTLPGGSRSTVRP